VTFFRRALIKGHGRDEAMTKESATMIDNVGSVTHAQPVARERDVRDRATEDRSKAVPSDSVQLSDAAKAALRESVETPEQTAKEALTGDIQAKRLLAQKSAAKEAEVHTKHVVA
jgi:hypothetical protein